MKHKETGLHICSCVYVLGQALQSERMTRDNDEDNVDNMSMTLPGTF